MAPQTEVGKRRLQLLDLYNVYCIGKASSAITQSLSSRDYERLMVAAGCARRQHAETNRHIGRARSSAAELLIDQFSVTERKKERERESE